MNPCKMFICGWSGGYKRDKGGESGGDRETISQGDSMYIKHE